MDLPGDDKAARNALAESSFTKERVQDRAMGLLADIAVQRQTALRRD